jgi:hypothetical protein
MDSESKVPTKSSAREDTIKFLDQIEPVLEQIKALCWPKDGMPANASEFTKFKDEALRLEKVAKEARRWIEVHGGIVRRRMKTHGRLSAENRALIDRLNIADLTLRGFLSAVEFVQTGTIKGGLLQIRR